MGLVVSIYAAILFFLLTPAILVRLPPGGSKWTVAAVHAIVFAILFHFTHKIVWQQYFYGECSSHIVYCSSSIVYFSCD